MSASSAKAPPPPGNSPAPPAISVVLPAYNARRYLKAAVTSILVQTFSDFELIVIDDGSTDDSKTLLESFAAADPRVLILSRANTGIVGALNDGLAVARGEFIARMDADDIALPTRFEKQLSFLRANPDVVCVGSAFNYMDERGALLKWNPRAADHAAIERGLLKGDGGSLIHPAIMARHAAIEKVGRYRLDAQWVEDLDLYLRLALIGRLANLPDVLLNYRYHSQSVNFTRNEGRRQRKLWVMEQACAARSLPFDPTQWPSPAIATAHNADDARDFALSSLRFENRATPWRYALRAVRLAPTDRRSWQTLSYVAKAAIGLVPRIQ